MVTTKNLLALDAFMESNCIPYILTGTFGLAVHGILPEGYNPDDIDIIVIANKEDEEEFIKCLVL